MENKKSNTELDNLNLNKDLSFKTPDNYFENLEDKLKKELSLETSNESKFTGIVRSMWWIGAVAAAVAIVFTVINFTNDKANTSVSYPVSVAEFQSVFIEDTESWTPLMADNDDFFESSSIELTGDEFIEGWIDETEDDSYDFLN